MEARTAIERLFHQPRIHRPIFGVLQRARSVRAECASQCLAKIPTSAVAVAIDNADFIIAKAVNAIFIEQEESVINKKLPHAITLKIENISSRPGLVGEEERVPIFRRCIFESVLPIEKPQTLSSKTATCVVEDKV